MIKLKKLPDKNLLSIIIFSLNLSDQQKIQNFLKQSDKKKKITNYNFL